MKKEQNNSKSITEKNSNNNDISLDNKEFLRLTKLREINRNANGDYYFIFDIPNVINYINTKGKPRNEVLIVGVPQKKLIYFLSNYINNDLKKNH